MFVALLAEPGLDLWRWDIDPHRGDESRHQFATFAILTLLPKAQARALG